MRPQDSASARIGAAGTGKRKMLHPASFGKGVGTNAIGEPGALALALALFGAAIALTVTPGHALAQGCSCGDEVLMRYSGHLKDSVTITVGATPVTVTSNSSSTADFVEGEAWVRVPPEEITAIDFDFAQTQDSGDGISCSFGCGDDYEVRQGASGTWRPGGSAYAASDTTDWSVRPANPNAGNNLPGSGTSSDPSGSMPQVGSISLGNYSSHPPAQASFTMHLGGQAGDLSFGGELESDGAFSDRSNISIHPPGLLPESQREVYTPPGGVLTEILAKKDYAAVAHIKIETVPSGGFEVQVSAPGTTGNPPWTPGARWVTYKVTGASHPSYAYGAKVEKIVGSPGSPSQTTTKYYYGSNASNLAYYEVQHIIAGGNTVIDRYTSDISGGVRSVTQKQIEVSGTNEITLSETTEDYQLGNFGREILTNRKVHYNATQSLESVYGYNIYGRLESVQERVGGVNGTWRMYGYESVDSTHRKVHEFSPWGSSPAKPASVPAPGTFTGRQRTTEYEFLTANTPGRSKSPPSSGPMAPSCPKPSSATAETQSPRSSRPGHLPARS